MSYRNEPKKHSSGAKERLLLFFVAIATVAFFNLNYAKASTAGENLNVIDMPLEASDFGAWFHSQSLPIVIEGHDFWDYFVYEERGIPEAPGYSVVLYTADGLWISGDGQSAMISTSNTYSCGGTFCYGFQFDVDPTSQGLINYNGGKNYYNDIPYAGNNMNLGAWYDGSTGFPVSPDSVLFSSQSFYYIDTCTITGQNPDTWYNSQGSENTAYNRCGSWDSSCSPVYTPFERGCAGEEPPVDPPVNTLSCTAVFDNIPGWTDPLGMFTGFFQALFSWFGCAFNGVLTGLHDSVVTASMIVGDFFSSATDTIGTYFSNITGSISGMFSGLTTSIAEKASFVSDVITGIPDATGVVFSTLFIPTSEYLSTQTDIIKTSFSEKFPALASMQASVSSGVSSLSGASTTFTSPTLSLYGSSNIPVVNTSVMNEYMPQIRTWVIMFLWFFCAIFCLRAIRNLIHPKTA